MLKKMRTRVIGAAMLAFSSVILLIALLVNVANYQVVTKRADETISHILDYENHTVSDSLTERLPPAPFQELPDLESNYMTRFFSVQLDETGRVCSTSMDYIASINESDAVEYARTALASGSSKGYAGEYRYQIASTGGRTTVCFLNTIREQRFMKELRMLTAGVALGSLLLVLLLIYLFSSKAIRPFASNIQRQKQFITDASHELKTPLTSISTSIDVISVEHGEDEWTKNIRKQTDRMAKLVGELVALAKMDEGTPLPNREVFSLSEAAWEIVEVYWPQAKAHGREMELQIQESLSYFGEKLSVQQMLSVLLDNAIRYSDEGSSIGFSIRERRGRVQIKVRTACSYETVPDVKRLFDRFYRPDSSRSANSGGSGIGLAIAKAVAEAHGGSISAQCPRGKYMIITVIL